MISSKEKLKQHLDQEKSYFLSQIAAKLSADDKNKVISAIQNYQLNKSIDEFFDCLVLIFKPIKKMQLLQGMKIFICQQHGSKFDWLMGMKVKPPTIDLQNNSWQPKIPIPNLHQCMQSAPVIKNNKPYRETSVHSNQNLHLNKYKLNSGGTSALPNKVLINPSKLKTISFLQPDCFENLGFGICGGLENHTEIFIGNVASQSHADLKGIDAGDIILEVNGIQFKKMTLSVAVKLLRNLKRLKLTLQKNGEKKYIGNFVTINPWTLEKVFPLMSNSIPNICEYQTDLFEDIPLRSIQIYFEDSSNSSIGFTIRGGSEFGIGIYVSRVNKGSAAQRSGLKLGDLIISLNSQDFGGISHHDAVNYIKMQKQLHLVVKSTGKVPESHQLIHEYSWLTSDGTREISRSPTPTLLHKTLLRKYSLRSSSRNSLTDDLCDIPIQKRTTSHQESSSIQNNNKNFTTTNELCTSMQQNNLLPCRHNIAEGNLGKPQGICTTTCEGQHEIIDNHYATGSHIFLVSNKEYEKNNIEKFTQDKNKRRRHSLDSNNTKNTANTCVHSRKGELIDSNPLVKYASLTDLSTVNSNGKENHLDKKKSGSMATLQNLKKVLNWKRNKKQKKNRDFSNISLFKGSNEKIKILDLQLQEKLTAKEYDTMKEHITDYLDDGDVEIFAVHILHALNTAVKYTILPHVRNIILSHEIDRFDRTISKHELQKIHYIHQQKQTEEERKKKQERSENSSPPTKIVSKKYQKGSTSYTLQRTDYDMYNSVRHIPKSSLVSAGLGTEGSMRHESAEFDCFVTDDEYKANSLERDTSLGCKAPVTLQSTFIKAGDSLGCDYTKKKHDQSLLPNSSNDYTLSDNHSRIEQPTEEYHNRHNTQEQDDFLKERGQSNNNKDLCFSDEEDVNITELYTPVKKSLSSKRQSEVKVTDSCSAYDVSMATTDINSTKSNITIKNVKIHKPDKIYEYDSHGGELLRSITRHSTASSLNSSLSSPYIEDSRSVSGSSDNSLKKGDLHTAIDKKIRDESQNSLKTQQCQKENGFREFILQKHFQTLGLSICGGINVIKQPDVKIYSIHPGSAAAFTSLKPGQTLISVDGESLTDVTHREAVSLLRLRFRDKSTNLMKLVVTDR